MRIVVTCGPSYEPVDDVRRITNFSTGELGTLLANALAEAGHEVVCFRGEAATTREQLRNAEHIPFSTNDDLLARLESLPNRDNVRALFHTAALSDFKVRHDRTERKLPTRGGPITLQLLPATKVIRHLPAIFPSARIVGWKYELDGSQADAIERARQQLADNGTAAVVVNGDAYGPGFGFITPDRPLAHLASKPELCRFLAEWIARP